MSEMGIYQYLKVASVLPCAKELRHCSAKLAFKVSPFPTWREFRVLRKRDDRLQLSRGVTQFAKVNPYVGGSIENVLLAGQSSPGRFGSKYKPCPVFWNRSIHSHFAEC